MKDGRRLTKTGALLRLPYGSPCSQVETALDKLSELPVRIYARSWSLVRYGLLELTQAYRQESAANNSGYNGSAALCLRLWKYGNFGASDARGTKAGVGVESIN